VPTVRAVFDDGLPPLHGAHDGLGTCKAQPTEQREGGGTVCFREGFGALGGDTNGRFPHELSKPSADAAFAPKEHRCDRAFRDGQRANDLSLDIRDGRFDVLRK
jgi:hypothetical protein